MKQVKANNLPIARRCVNGLRQLSLRWAFSRQLAHQRLDRLDQIVLDGASKGIVRRRTGNCIRDWLNNVYFVLCQWFDRLDTRYWFLGRPYQAKTCRVRSKAEKKIANYFYGQGIVFQYEPKLRLGEIRRLFIPDFYLPEYSIYVEYWGLSGSFNKYDRDRRRKERWYRKYSICYLSLEPGDERRLPTVFSQRLAELTGCSLSERPYSKEWGGDVEGNRLRPESIKVVTNNFIRHWRSRKRGAEVKTLMTIGSIVAVLVIGAIILIPNAGSHLQAKRQEAAKALDRASSDEELGIIVQQKMDSVSQDLKTQYENVFNLRTAMVQLDATTKANQQNLKDSEAILGKAQRLLGQHQPGATITIGSNSYSWEQVNADALDRVANCKRLRDIIASQTHSYSQLQASFNNAMSKIEQAKHELVRRQQEFEAKKAELAAYRAQSYYNQLANQANVNVTNVDSALVQAQKAFDDRLNTLKADAEYAETMPKTSSVNWSAEYDLPGNRATDAINQYFHPQSVPTTSSQPSVGTALQDAATSHSL